MIYIKNNFNYFLNLKIHTYFIYISYIFITKKTFNKRKYFKIFKIKETLKLSSLVFQKLLF